METTTPTWATALLASVEAAKVKALEALSRARTKRVYTRVQATEEMLRADESYRLNKQKAAKAEENKDAAKDALLKLTSTEENGVVTFREVEIINRDKKIGVIMNVPKRSLDWDKLKIEHPDIALLLDQSYMKQSDGWQYRTA